MISKRMTEELNKQINTEFAAAYMYFGMAAYCTAQNFDGFGRWLLLQAEEEISHGMKLYKYLIDQGQEVTTPAIPAQKSSYSSFDEVFKKALDSEKDLATRFNELSFIAREEKDNATLFFLEWFLAEQVEEVATLSSVLEKVKLIKGDGTGLLMLDNELGTRKAEQA